MSVGLSVYAYNAAYRYVLSLANIPPVVEIFESNNPSATKVVSAISSQEPAPSLSPENDLPKAWDGKERINILLMGIDQRQGEVERGYRTDTMILITIDPVSGQAGMLSIPRDLWVPIPGYGNNRINLANYYGDADDYPGGGAALAKKTVEQLIGVRVHHAVRVNFTAFENFIDRIGGVTVDVPEDIYDPKYPTNNYGIEVFSIKKGKQTLDGTTALKYARTRNTKFGDFDRAKRQQQVILAAQEKLKDVRVAMSLFAAGPDLLADLSASIKTDMPLSMIQQLGRLGMTIDRANIKSAVIDQNYTEPITTAEGQQVEIANRARIVELRTSLFR
ncbi:MAG: LCP family protein [Anaerolineae bacterium]|nr:LCP family protein [Anaerolineae bacterium]